MSAHVHIHFPDGYEEHARRLVDQVNDDRYLSWITGLDETEIADCTATLLTIVEVTDVLFPRYGGVQAKLFTSTPGDGVPGGEAG